MSRFLTNDESRSINPADNELGTIRDHDGPDGACPFDGRPFTEDGECPKCGYRDFIRETTPDLEAALAELEETGALIRAERDRLGIELEAARQARRIVELGAGEELWRWRFTWFWTAVAYVSQVTCAEQKLRGLSHDLAHACMPDCDGQAPGLDHEEIEDLYADAQSARGWLHYQEVV
jgi:hypothetical protein